MDSQAASLPQEEVEDQEAVHPAQVVSTQALCLEQKFYRVYLLLRMPNLMSATWLPGIRSDQRSVGPAWGAAPTEHGTATGRVS